MADVSVFWNGEPEHASEREFLRRLRADLEARNVDALILANFYTGSARQVDFFICHYGPRLSR
jgi:hypothetical protein